MTKRILPAILAAFFVLAPAFAGDVATFVNLGFSADSSHFMFGQYGADQASGKPYAEIYLVDTKKNVFVPQGSKRSVYEAKVEPGQDTSGALFALFAESAPLAKAKKIDHLAPGRLLYVLLDGQDPPALLTFRDFKTETSYDISVVKSIAENKDGAISSFGLAITATERDGSVKRVTAGNPDLKRKGVRDYVIRRVIAAPDEKTLVLIIEKLVAEKGDSSVRYMVETVKLP